MVHRATANEWLTCHPRLDYEIVIAEQLVLQERIEPVGQLAALCDASV